MERENHIKFPKLPIFWKSEIWSWLTLNHVPNPKFPLLSLFSIPLPPSPSPIPHLHPNKKIPLLATSSQSPFKKIKVTI